MSYFPIPASLLKSKEEYNSLVNSHFDSSDTTLNKKPLWLKTGSIHYDKTLSTLNSEKRGKRNSVKIMTSKNIEILEKTNKVVEGLLSETVRKTDKLIKIKNPSSNNLQNLKDSFKVLRKNKDIEREINLCLEAVGFISGKNIIAFTAIEAPGIFFVKPRNTNESILFFAEHIVHEVSHIVLNYVFIDIKKYFIIDPFSLEFKSPFRTEERGLYHVIQALYVLAKITLFFETLSRSEFFQQKKYHYEIIGRLALASYRLETNIKEIDGNYYTQEGKKLLKFILNTAKKYGYSKNSLVSKFKIAKQGIEYNHEIFLKENNL